jgi:hypothetical protein
MGARINRKNFWLCLPCVLVLVSVLMRGCLFQPVHVRSDWHARCVFLTGRRLTELQRRVAGKQEPTYTAFKRLEQSAQTKLHLRIEIPACWQVCNYYEDRVRHRQERKSLQEGAAAAWELALYYRMSGKEEYASACARLLNDWAQVRQFSGAGDSRLCFSYYFPTMLCAADLIRNSPSWSPAEQEIFRRFVREKAVNEATEWWRPNNWGNWGTVLELACGAYLDDRSLFERGLTRWRNLGVLQITEDGVMPLEIYRSGGRKGLWYSTFCLMAQSAGAEIAWVNGVDLFDSSSGAGKKMKHAYERIASWTQHPETFPYFNGPAGMLEGVYNVSYFEILQGHWPNDNASAVLSRLRPVTSEYVVPDLTFTHGDLPCQ